MTHPDDARLVAHALGDDDAPEREAVAQHLRTCLACREALDELRRVLEVATVEAPPRGPDYGAHVWARIERRLYPPARRIVNRAWLAAAAAILIAVCSFLVGRWWGPATPPSAVTDARALEPRAIQQRVVLAALGEHLDRAERALVEIANTDAREDVDLGSEQAWARDLLEANRLYRQSARGAASPVVVDLLADIEPILLEIVNSPRHLPPDELRALQARIERHSLVFKLRVTGAEVRSRQRPSFASGVPTS
jgi:hypothetical protein